MFDSEEYFTFDGVELAELERELASANDEEVFPFPFPFQTKKAKGEEYRVYSNNEEVRDWLNSGLAEGALRFPVDRRRRGCGEIVEGYEAHQICDVLVGALRSVLTTGDNTRAMEPAKAWSLLRTLTTIERDSVRRHGEVRHKGIHGHALSDSAVDFQVKSLRAAGAALWELKAKGLRLDEKAAEDHTGGVEMTVWSSPNEDGEVFPVRVVSWAEVMAEDAKKRTAWEDAMPAATPEKAKPCAAKIPRLTDAQVKRVTSIKAKIEKKARASHKANRKAAERSYSIPMWLDGYHREMRAMERTEDQWLQSQGTNEN
ncbi:TPA: hypothetical protein MBH54_005666 [Klebsiella pneumoniae]|nr:hypothetical protein [Klebsiella pneumoniae]